MSSGVQVRHGESGDSDALLHFWRIAGENDSRPVDTGEALARLLMRDPEAVLIAEDGARVVGTVIAGWDGWRAHLYRLAVLPERRREGIGRRLVAAAEERLGALGATRIDAMVLSANELAHHTWRAAGYTPQQNWSRWVKPVN
jgi:ribosomal protein S18 acetylase RimI-like enzyme